MLKAILFDLDDTLLGNAMERFVPAYFRLLTARVAHLAEPGAFVAHLMRATDAMVANVDPAVTCQHAFDTVFFPAFGHDRADLMPIFDDFYARDFGQLRALTQVRPAARRVVTRALARGLDVAITTNPLFPATAIEQRLAWAEVPVDEFPYALVTSYERMHAAKPHPAYYREVLDCLGRAAADCLMVGDNLAADILPAQALGIPVYWIAPPDAAGAPDRLAGQGTLDDFECWLETQAGTGC